MTDHDERDLEDAFRASLQRHAEEIDVSVPVAERAVAANRRRRQGIVVMAVAAVAVAAVAIGGTWIAGDPEGEDAPRLADRSSDPAEVVTEWRTEYWHGLQVDVPTDWGWGTAPVSSGELEYLCGGPGAMVLADGRRIVNADAGEPWVGRPIRLSDACIGGDPIEKPGSPYVWLGADIEPGRVELAGGFTQETVEVNGSTLTVATRDEGLRRTIIESARTTQGPCPQAYGDVPAAGLEEGSDLYDSEDLVVCAYRGSQGRYDLTYGDVLGGRAEDDPSWAFREAARDSSEVLDGCSPTREREFVVLRTAGLRFVVTFDCPGIRQPGSEMLLELSEQNVAPWAVGGIRATVRGPLGTAGRWVYDYFIGSMG